METDAAIERNILVKDSGVTAVNLLAEHTGLSKSKIKDAMIKGAVWITEAGKQKRLRRATKELHKDNSVAIYYSPKILATRPPAPTLIADKGSYTVWHKPAGMMASGSRYGDHCAIDRIVERNLDRPTFLIHRLDRFVWGVMVLAHSKAVAADLSRQFQTRQTVKRYKAIIHGQLDEKQTIDLVLDGKDAVTHVTPVDHDGDRTLTNVIIETGRKHQIRKHLSMVGHPVVGDRQYGSDDRTGIRLAATSLEFVCPGKGVPVSFKLSKEHHPRLD